ncbi:MAG: protein tyrosine phosphatase [Ahrensia sp.]
MSQIVVCPLSALEKTVAAYQASHVLTLISEDMPVPTPEGISGDNHLTLHFNDVAVAAPGLRLAGKGDVDRMIAFIKDWDQSAPLVIHCWMGVSRSTAGAMTALAALQPDRPAMEIASELRFAAPFASPNPRIIALADKALGRNDTMILAADAIGIGADCFEGSPFALEV